jgi:hypothetical protein
VNIGDQTFPYLEPLSREIPTVVFHRRDGSISPSISVQDEKAFACELSRLKPHEAQYDGRFNLLLQRFLQQYAYTSIVNGATWGAALCEVMGSPIFQIGKKKHQSMQADIYERPDGSVRIQYCFQAPICSIQGDDDRAIGRFTIPFFYDLQRNPDTQAWEVKGPTLQPISYSSK